MCHKFWLCQLFLCTYLLLCAPFHDRNFHNHATDTSMMGIVTFFWHGCAIKSKLQTEMVYEHRQRMSLEWKHKWTCVCSFEASLCFRWLKQSPAFGGDSAPVLSILFLTTVTFAVHFTTDVTTVTLRRPAVPQSGAVGFPEAVMKVPT